MKQPAKGELVHQLRALAALVSLLISPPAAQAQEHQPEHETEDHPRHMISLEIGHSHLSEGVRNGEKEWIIVPSWAINYSYLLSEKWIVGLHTDIIIENFEVESNRSDEAGTIKRTRPVSMVGAVAYKPLPRLAVITGAGFEYAPEETFALFRLGLEPSIELSHKWEIIFSVVYDIKVDAYNNWSMGMGVARLF